jgi:hypothetical protein
MYIRTPIVGVKTVKSLRFRVKGKLMREKSLNCVVVCKYITLPEARKQSATSLF